MRFEGLFIAGAALHLPPPVAVRDAVRAGWCEPELESSTRMVSVRVSDTLSAPEMTIRAARAALRSAGRDPADLALLLHATAYYQGLDEWPAPSFVQREVAGSSHCPAMEVRQMSNGGMAALDLACHYLDGAPEDRAALLTAGDRFSPPGFDRWRTDPGTFYADGAAAVVVTRRPGFARIVALVSHSEPGLEGMHRGDDLFADAPFTHRRPIDMGVWQKAFIARHGMPYTAARVSRGGRTSLETVLAEAGADLADIDHFVLPNLGLHRLDSGYFRRYGIPVERSTWEWGRTVGHLGPADQFAGLARLWQDGRLAPGQRVLLLGVGAGFTWSGAVLEVLAPAAGR